VSVLARAKQVRRMLRVGPGPVDLADIDPRATPGLPSRLTDDAKAWSRAETAKVGAHLGACQERLFAAAKAGSDRRRILLVLQAVDCGGKDGTIKSVVGSFNPQGVHVTSFGPPTEEERAHHFLWRVDRALPPSGHVGVFNRSQYEDVLAVRVRSLAPPRVWQARYDQINRFERDQVADGMVVVKIMLHISRSEQRQRLLARLDDPTKRWKFNVTDLDDRALWDDYQEAYAAVLTRCSTEYAPWYVVPADRKWYRNWAVASIILAHLADMFLTYPEVTLDVAKLRNLLESEQTTV
jgi:PPK2 family polyphosphate:nucleotide phosphotransferase